MAAGAQRVGLRAVAIRAGPAGQRRPVQRGVRAGGSRCGLDVGLGPHCLRHSYVTHLIEDGYDGLFVQQQVGHEYASTTAIYTSVSSDYRTRTLRAALDRAASCRRDGEGGAR